MSAGLTMEASSAFVDLGFCREKLNHDLRLSGFIMAALKKESVCRGEVEVFIMSIVSRCCFVFVVESINEATCIVPGGAWTNSC